MNLMEILKRLIRSKEIGLFLKKSTRYFFKKCVHLLCLKMCVLEFSGSNDFERIERGAFLQEIQKVFWVYVPCEF